jgi:F-type H+-transporting ATPase subunit delta
MVSSKAIRRDARALYKLSLDAVGSLDASRVAAILAALDANPPPAYLPMLRAYLRLVSAEVARGEARIAHAGPLSQTEAQAIADAFARHYKRHVTPVMHSDPALIAGIRVQVGDDVHELSAAGTLAAIAEAAN